jgi:DNA-directed RNA polymerase subunit M
MSEDNPGGLDVSFEDFSDETELTEEQERDEDDRIRGAETESRATTPVQCVNEDCDGDRAYYEMKQIRAADESETRFLECVKCGHKWREDDH